MCTLIKNKLFSVFCFAFLIFSGFSYAQPSNDDFANAIDVTALINLCSTDAAYTTIGGTPDLNAGSCWNNSGPLFNVWFKFTAPASGQINITVDRGGAQGSQDRTQLALWQNDGTTEVNCKIYSQSGEDVVVGSTSLTPGVEYYISVDAFDSNYDGTFTLCLADAVDYDYYEGATDITSLIGTCSADAAYTTKGGSADQGNGSCWYNGPNFNRWFKFTAPASGQINITADINSTKGTQAKTMLALWDSDGTTELNCSVYTSTFQDVTIAGLNLTPGNVYYLSVDTFEAARQGTFTLCVEDAVDYDYYEGAEDVTSLFGTCSADAAYTTVSATPDQNAGSCWNNGGPLLNRWFKFTAPLSGNVNIKVDIGSGKGTQTRTQLALWEADGTTEVACSVYGGANDDVSVNALGLTSGDTYYISVDAFSATYDGTFTLCLEDEPDYDYYEGAVDVTSLIGTCSADAEYSTSGGTPDRNAGSCWNNGGPLMNRWFKFTAPANGIISATIDINSGKGTQNRTMAALWEADGTTQVACKLYGNTFEDVVISSLSLTPSATYYLSVDTFSDSYDGTFTLCLEDAVDYDYYEGAEDITSLIGTCSADAAYTTTGASADKNAGSCWYSGPTHNRWFSFVAPATGEINVTVDVNSTKGTMGKTMAAIWESDGVTEVNCVAFVATAEDVVIASTSLTPGNTYYLSIDTFESANAGTFTLCVEDAVDYDYYEGAVDVTTLINSCSSDAEFSTIAAHGDRNAGSCWYSGPGYNRWFKFTAPATGILTATTDIGGTKGTQTRTYMAIWESDGTTEVSCKAYSNSTDDVAVSANGLTPGSTYYISVDVFDNNNDGTFTLCLQDSYDYDFYEGAYEITDLDGWCSADEAFTTKGATPDLNPGSCWDNGGPVQNRWFKFRAIHSDVSITVDIASGKGDQTFTQLALWESDGTTEVDCNKYTFSTEDVTISNTTLTAGNWYYISVDVFDDTRDGTFTLCVDNVQNRYYSTADGDYNNGNTWSLVGHGGAVAGSVPGDGDVVYIEGHTITVSDAQSCGGLTMNVASANTQLISDGNLLTVNGDLNLNNTGVDFDGTISLVNNGNINVTGNANLNRSGGANAFGVSIATGSTFTVGNDMVWTSSGGSTTNSTLAVAGTGALTIGNDLNLIYTAGNAIYFQMDGSSKLTVGNDLNYNCSTNSVCEIVFNSSAALDIMSDISRSGGYGILTFNGTAVLTYMGGYTQTIPQNSGTGGDGLTFTSIVINNTGDNAPQVLLEGDVSLSGTLTLTDGIVQTSSSAGLSLASGATLSGGNTGSFVDGPLSKTGNTDFNFQIGNGTTWAPLAIGNLTGDAATVFTAEYTGGSYSDMTLKTSDPNGDLNNISSIEYWDLTNTGTASNADLTLYWKNNVISGIDDASELVIAHYTGSEWENLDVSALNDAGVTGDITVNGVSSFSPFTFGSKSAVVNPLPVELLSFTAQSHSNRVELNWQTASELNNDYFNIERSSDGTDFYSIGTIEGAGDSEKILAYTYNDVEPLRGTSYYRLKQVDFDGASTYSSVISSEGSIGSDLAFEVYPNPSRVGQGVVLQASGINKTEQVQLLVHDLTGKVLFNTRVLAKDLAQISNEISKIKKGVYGISILTSKGKISRMLSIQ